MRPGAATDDRNELVLPVRVGQSFVRDVVFTAQCIRDFALLAGDPNPLHHDEATARLSRFGGLIAAGTQTSTMLAGAVAHSLCSLKPSLGLDMSFKFRRAVPADEPLVAKWGVVAVSHSCRLNGDVVTISCELRDMRGALLVHGTVVSLVRE